MSSDRTTRLALAATLLGLSFAGTSAAFAQELNPNLSLPGPSGASPVLPGPGGSNALNSSGGALAPLVPTGRSELMEQAARLQDQLLIMELAAKKVEKELELTKKLNELRVLQDPEVEAEKARETGEITAPAMPLPLPVAQPELPVPAPVLPATAGVGQPIGFPPVGAPVSDPIIAGGLPTAGPAPVIAEPRVTRVKKQSGRIAADISLPGGGTITAYENDPLPGGWQVTSIGIDGVTVRRPGGSEELLAFGGIEERSGPSGP